MKEMLSRFEIQKNADKESLKAMQEIVEKLTADKLAVANDLESYKTKLGKVELNSNEPSSSVSAENESLKMQLNKLIAENKGLIQDLANLEKKFIQEMSTSQAECHEMQGRLNEIEKLKVELKQARDVSDEHLKTIEFLQAEITIKNDELRSLEDEVRKIQEEFHSIKSKGEENDVEQFEAEEKVALLEEQIQGHLQTIQTQDEKITELKHEISSLKGAPSEDEVSKLQTEVAVLRDRLSMLEGESSSKSDIIDLLKKDKNQLEIQCEELHQQMNKFDELEAIKSELEKYKELTKLLQSQLDDCQEIRSAKMKECEELK